MHILLHFAKYIMDRIFCGTRSMFREVHTASKNSRAEHNPNYSSVVNKTMLNVLKTSLEVKKEKKICGDQS